MSDRRKLALVGMGKMGRAIEQLAPERGWDVVARIGADANRNGSGITSASLRGADVAIEFTRPNAAVANVRAAVEAKCPIVVGTTGWYDELPAMTEWVTKRGGALLTSPNFSLGVNAFVEIVALASRLFHRAGAFDVHLVETHHAAKKDAPSGTAVTLKTAAERGWTREIPTTSIRTGSVPGIHELIFDAPFETVTLTHTARDRRAFAEGVLVAADWLIGRTGVFTMRDVLSADSSNPTG
ncbi:MAG TPA: dihydrodipicolinate reductase C-terminal domain-containing protein [Gemmatimonadaceae bacterium]|jgi:4-hydroxy-tetrahydrodipicolinate reductase|nr:dihydrodipicolinate reductase C-terminal domain-containing protein [Gemmatimonadaceae bacterium]